MVKSHTRSYTKLCSVTYTRTHGCGICQDYQQCILVLRIFVDFSPVQIDVIPAVYPVQHTLSTRMEFLTTKMCTNVLSPQALVRAT